MRWYRAFKWIPGMGEMLYKEKVMIFKLRGKGIRVVKERGRIVWSQKKKETKHLEIDLMKAKETAPLPPYDYMERGLSYLNTAKGIYIPVKWEIEGKDKILLSSADLQGAKGFYIQEVQRNVDSILKPGLWEKYQGAITMGALAVLFIIGLWIVMQTQEQLIGQTAGVSSQLARALEYLGAVMDKLGGSVPAPP